MSKYAELKNQKKVAELLNIKLSVVKQIVPAKSNQKYVIQYDKDMNEIQRFGTISECCNYLMNSGLVKTKILKTCRNTLLRNIDKFWNNYYFKLLDA
jgi:hypothetical protein